MSKFRGGGSLPPKPSSVQLLKGLVGGTLGILCLCILGDYSGSPWLMAPFGATCVLLFAVPISPLAQPRNVIGGHLISASIGLAALYALGDSYVVMSLAVGVSIMTMQYLRAVHPPAGANPIVIILAGKSIVGFDFLLFPVLSGSIILILISTLVNNYGVKEGWPHYWLGTEKN
ncbi:HPP family protein [Vibrio cholerae]